jgi:hypothetical protein
MLCVASVEGFRTAIEEDFGLSGLPPKRDSGLPRGGLHSASEEGYGSRPPTRALLGIRIQVFLVLRYSNSGLPPKRTPGFPSLGGARSASEEGFFQVVVPTSIMPLGELPLRVGELALRVASVQGFRTASDEDFGPSGLPPKRDSGLPRGGLRSGIRRGLHSGVCLLRRFEFRSAPKEDFGFPFIGGGAGLPSKIRGSFRLWSLQR